MSAIKQSLKRVFLRQLCVLFSILLCACSSNHVQDGPPDFKIDVSHIPNATPKYVPKSRYGNPASYEVNGKRYYVLKSAVGYRQRGIASWYGTKFNGHLTSDHEQYNMLAMTAASKVLPIPSYARITNLENGRSVIVRINDRGPFKRNRIIDLSYAAAKKLGYARKGTALVEVATINPRNPASTPAAVAMRHPRLFLQLGAFSNYHYAAHLANRLQNDTYQPVHINQGWYHNQLIYRVQVGPLTGVGELDKLQAKLKQDGFGNALTVIR